MDGTPIELVDDCGVLTPSARYIAARISELYGFRLDKIKVQRVGYLGSIESMGYTIKLPTSAVFTVCGLGYSTMFDRNYERARLWDDEMNKTLPDEFYEDGE